MLCSPTTVMTLTGSMETTLLLDSMLVAPPMIIIHSVLALMLATLTVRATHHPYGTMLCMMSTHWDQMALLLLLWEVITIIYNNTCWGCMHTRDQLRDCVHSCRLMLDCWIYRLLQWFSVLWCSDLWLLLWLWLPQVWRLLQWYKWNLCKDHTQSRYGIIITAKESSMQNHTLI